MGLACKLSARASAKRTTTTQPYQPHPAAPVLTVVSAELVDGGDGAKHLLVEQPHVHGAACSASSASRRGGRQAGEGRWGGGEEVGGG